MSILAIAGLIALMLFAIARATAKSRATRDWMPWDVHDDQRRMQRNGQSNWHGWRR